MEAPIIDSVEIEVPNISDWLPVVWVDIVKVDLAVFEMRIQCKQDLFLAESLIRIEEEGDR